MDLLNTTGLSGTGIIRFGVAAEIGSQELEVVAMSCRNVCERVGAKGACGRFGSLNDIGMKY
jgi:hypothetical protein